MLIWAAYVCYLMPWLPKAGMGLGSAAQFRPVPALQAITLGLDSQNGLGQTTLKLPTGPKKQGSFTTDSLTRLPWSHLNTQGC